MKKKKMMMSDLPRDIEEEVLCRIPLTCLGLVRSTCKRWNMLSRCDHFFANKHLAHLAAEEAKKKDQPLVVMMMNHRVELMRLNLSNNEDVAAVVTPEAKLIGLDQIDVREIFHCDGLLLCIPKEDSYRLLVWNPYWGRGQLRWIENTHNHDLVDKHLYGHLDTYTYGLGYDSSSHYKILRFIDYHPNFVEFKIYDFNSDSWRILDLLSRPDNWNIKSGERGLSLKGNTYWFASEAGNYYDAISFLVRFDFTTETFSPPLPLPFEAFPDDTLILSSSSSSSEYPPQLVVLFQCGDTSEMEIWISNTIEQQPNAGLSWNSKVFLSANIEQLIHPWWLFLRSACFFIDQEKKVAVVFDKNDRSGVSTREIAYIFVGGGGVDDDGSSLKQQVVKESPYPFCYSHAFYYVPSLVQLN